MRLGERIRARAEALGLSQSEVGRRAGIKQSTINTLINSDARSTPFLIELAAVLQTTPAYLMGSIDDPDLGAPPPPPPATHQFVTMQVAMPSEEALAEMFGALLLAMPEGATLAEQAVLLAQRLPKGLSQLQGLMRMTPARPEPKTAKPPRAATRHREATS